MMRVDVLSSAGIRAWDMPTTDTDSRLEKNGATENGMSRPADRGSRTRAGAGDTDGARVKERPRLGLDKVHWCLRGEESL